MQWQIEMQSRYYGEMRFPLLLWVVGLLAAYGENCLGGSFEDVAPQAGLTHEHYPSGRAPLMGIQAFMAGGAAAVDYDNDGWTDLYFTRLDQSDLLYRNAGDGTFEDVTTRAFGHGHLASIHTNGCAWADIDNDGDQDLYVTSLQSNRYYLFINDGQGSFSEEAQVRGASLMGSDLHYGFSASFGDYDNDGFLDIHVNEWRTAEQNLTRSPSNTKLLRNRGALAPGHFDDVTAAAGVLMELPMGGSMAFSSRFLDLDFDGWPELLAVSDGGTSRLFWNNRDGTFTDGTREAGVGTDQYGMGMAVGDFDADGDFDWFITSIHGHNGGDGNRLFRYDGNRRFTDVTDQSRVRIGGWGWGCSFLDYNNDGDLDLMMVNGMNGVADDMSLLWRNTGGGVMSQVNFFEGITDNRIATGTLTLDYDNDGDVDLLVVNNGHKPILYRNNSSTRMDWLQVKAVGTRSNRDGVGAIVRLYTSDSDVPLSRFVDGGSNFLGQNERRVHFGLGELTRSIDKLEVTWPSGRIQRLYDILPNQVLTITEPPPRQLNLTRLPMLEGRPYPTWSCQPDSRCLLEVSEDLYSWRKAAVIESREHEVSWHDREAPGRLKRFYRAWY